MASNPLLTMLLAALLLETATAEYLDKAATKAACKSKVNEEECAGHDGALFPLSRRARGRPPPPPNLCRRRAIYPALSTTPRRLLLVECLVGWHLELQGRLEAVRPVRRQEEE